MFLYLIKSKRPSGKPSPTTESAEKSIEHKIESWTNSKGQKIRGKFIALTYDKITIEMANGKK